MSAKTTVEISEKARAVAAERATANGFSSAGEYIDALLLEDEELDVIARQPWFLKKIEEGEASPIVGELTPERIDQLVQQGIARARARK